MDGAQFLLPIANELADAARKAALDAAALDVKLAAEAINAQLMLNVEAA